MIEVQNITIRNFLSIGNVPQAVKFDSNDLTLILGENLDIGDSGSRNGCGKTSLLQALTYALFGAPINKIRKDNLINRTNGKEMMVTLEFTSNGTSYKIERGRKPNILRFYVDSNLQKSKEEDSAQGENKQTQAAIEKAIGMSADMFKHLVALNTHTEPFLGMGSNDQRNIIEQLLGITLLSEKAAAVSEKMKANKERFIAEEFRIRAIEEANKRVSEQIDSLKRRQRLWQTKHDADLAKLVSDYDDLSTIDIDAELQAHRELAQYNELRKQVDLCNTLKARQIAWRQKITSDVSSLQQTYDSLSHIDITAELQAHRDLAEWKRKKAEHDALTTTRATLNKTVTKDKNVIDKLLGEIATLESNKCHTCGNTFHDEQHSSVLAAKREQLASTQEELFQTKTELEKIISSLSELELQAAPVTHYKTEAEAIKHSSELERIQHQITAKLAEEDPYKDQIDEQCQDIVLGEMPKVHYSTEAEAIAHRETVSNLLNLITTKSEESDPYQEQLVDMESNALQEIDFTVINECNKIGEHLKFLLDLLTNKDSFIRKRIIDQNLSYLNDRLTHYLDAIGLPHQVVFKNDLSVEITELGREMDYHNLSKGEMNRVILALSWAFRDVWENLYQPINILFIDELLDNGTDSIGVENSMSILKRMTRERNKSIWLVSHRDDLVSRVNNVLKVVKSGGFTSYESTVSDDI